MCAPVIISSFRKNARETLRIALDTYQGHDLLDLRVCVPLSDHSPDQMPTKKGVSFNVAVLPDIIASLQAAEAKARDLGMLGGDA